MSSKFSQTLKSSSPTLYTHPFNRRLKLLQRSLERRGCNKVCEELEVETSLVVALQATSDMEFTKRLLEYKEGLCTTDRYMDSNMYDKLI